MAWNNYFPATYNQNPYQGYSMGQPNNYIQQPGNNQTNTNMQWVQGIEGAKAYQQPPNTITPLWDSDAQTVYLKSTDASGRPSIEPIDYVYRNRQNDNMSSKAEVVDVKSHDMSTYATKDDMNVIMEELAALRKELSNSNKKKGGNNNER